MGNKLVNSESLEALIINEKVALAGKADKADAMSQADADERYLKLSGGTMTGTIKGANGSIVQDPLGNDIIYASNNSANTVLIGSESRALGFRTQNNNISHYRNGQWYPMLDTANTEANPTLAGTEAELTGLKINGTSYKVPEPVELSTTEVNAIWNGGYDITTTITNGTASGATKVLVTPVQITITPDSGYILPVSVNVVGATSAYNSSTGVVTISDPTGAVSLSAICDVEPAPVSGVYATVAGLGSSSPSSVTFTKDADFTVVGLGIEQTTMGGDTFIKIPTMYRKVNSVSNNQITSYTIANAKIDNTYEPYPVFVAEDGETVMPYVLIGKYWNTNFSSMVSTTETTSTATMTIGNARTYARNRGTGYQQYDWMFWKLWQDLETCLAGTVNINSGSGLTYDALGIYWSTPGFWIDGLCHNSSVIAVSNKPTQYVDQATTSSTGYYGVSYNLPTSDGEIMTLGYDANHPFVNVASGTTSNSSYNTYYCDGYYYASGSRPLVSDVGDTGAYSGAFYAYADYAWSGARSARLCYRPLAA